MNDKPSVAIVFPSNKTGIATKHILSTSSIDSLNAFAEHVDLTIVMVAQGAALLQDMETAKLDCAANGIRLIVIEQPERNPCSIFALRTAGALAAGDVTYIMNIDDDATFVPDSSRVYSECVDYLEANSDCGSVACCGFFGSATFGDHVKPDRQGWMVENGKGLFLRNVFKGHPFPTECENFVGGFEESLAVLKLNRAGYYHAKKFKVRTKHVRPKPIVANGGSDAGHEDGGRERDNQLHSAALTEENAFAWIRKNVLSNYRYGAKLLNLGWKF